MSSGFVAIKQQRYEEHLESLQKFLSCVRIRSYDDPQRNDGLLRFLQQSKQNQRNESN